MTDKDAFAERGRSLEEEYFHRKERELIERMRRQSEADANRRRLAEQAGVSNEQLLLDLEALGYTSETIRLLHLVPLIQMAWTEGGVSARERELIVQAARTRGIREGSAADQQLNVWLNSRPSDEFFEKSLQAISAVLHSQSTGEGQAGDLLSLATAIASASGGLMGFHSVSHDEKQLLDKIRQELAVRKT